jgi:hypothetical protein
MDFEKLKVVERQKNINILREQINDKWIKTKIENYLNRNYYLDLTIEDIKKRILEDDLTASFFIKDPKTQNFTEKLIADKVKKISIIENFKNYSSNVKLFLYDGEVQSERNYNLKSIDYSIKCKGKRIYITQKYTTGNGGSQDNQFIDVLNFLEKSKIKKGSNLIAMALVDGSYYTKDKLDKLKQYENENTVVLSVDELQNYLENL